MNVMETYKKAYELFRECTECCCNKYEWAAGEIFGLTTYDPALDKLFIERIIDVCLYIAAGKTYEFIRLSNENYITYILVCQLLKRKQWIEWGTSIRGVWFDICTDSEPILDWWCDNETFYVSFDEENLLTLIQFLQEEEQK